MFTGKGVNKVRPFCFMPGNAEFVPQAALPGHSAGVMLSVTLFLAPRLM